MATSAQLTQGPAGAMALPVADDLAAAVALLEAKKAKGPSRRKTAAKKKVSAKKTTAKKTTAKKKAPVKKKAPAKKSKKS